jgi:hypothetical protein
MLQSSPTVAWRLGAVNRADANAGLGGYCPHAQASRQQWRNLGPSGILLLRRPGAAKCALSVLIDDYTAHVPERRILVSGLAVI